MDSKLQKYIEDASKAGVNTEDIRKALASAGWDAKKVDAALSNSHGLRKSKNGPMIAIVLGIAALAIGTVIGGITFFSEIRRMVPQPAQTPPPTPAAAIPTPQPTPAPSPLPTAQPTPDLTACDRLAADSSQQFDCVRDIAVAAKDAAVCDFPKISGWKPLCLLAVAEVVTDESVCSYFKVHYTGFMEHCIGNVAVANRNAVRCSTIQDTSWHDECYSKIADALDQVELCAPIIEEEERDHCWTAIAQDTQDSTVCERITDTDRKTACQRAVDFWP